MEMVIHQKIIETIEVLKLMIIFNKKTNILD